MTWKFVDILSLTYRHNIDIESTSIPRDVSVGYVIAMKTLSPFQFLK